MARKLSTLNKIKLGAGLLFVFLSIIALLGTSFFLFGLKHQMVEDYESKVMYEIQHTNSSNPAEFKQSQVNMSIYSLNWEVAIFGTLILIALEIIILLMAMKIAFKALQ